MSQLWVCLSHISPERLRFPTVSTSPRLPAKHRPFQRDLCHFPVPDTCHEVVFRPNTSETKVSPWIKMIMDACYFLWEGSFGQSNSIGTVLKMLEKINTWPGTWSWNEEPANRRHLVTSFKLWGPSSVDAPNLHSLNFEFCMSFSYTILQNFILSLRAKFSSLFHSFCMFCAHHPHSTQNFPSPAGDLRWDARTGKGRYTKRTRWAQFAQWNMLSASVHLPQRNKQTNISQQKNHLSKVIKYKTIGSHKKTKNITTCNVFLRLDFHATGASSCVCKRSKRVDTELSSTASPIFTTRPPNLDMLKESWKSCLQKRRETCFGGWM